MRHASNALIAWSTRERTVTAGLDAWPHMLLEVLEARVAGVSNRRRRQALEQLSHLRPDGRQGALHMQHNRLVLA